MQDAGFKMQDSRCRIQEDSRRFKPKRNMYRIQDSGFRRLGHSISQFSESPCSPDSSNFAPTCIPVSDLSEQALRSSDGRSNGNTHESSRIFSMPVGRGFTPDGFFRHHRFRVDPQGIVRRKFGMTHGVYSVLHGALPPPWGTGQAVPHGEVAQNSAPIGSGISLRSTCIPERSRRQVFKLSRSGTLHLASSLPVSSASCILNPASCVFCLVSGLLHPESCIPHPASSVSSILSYKA
jgi:hypothetical protein